MIGSGTLINVGAIQDGISGDFSTLAVKSVLDLIIVMMMTSSLGKGCAFSAIPILIFCVGVNLVWGKTLRAANMLPAVLLAAGAAYLPWSF